ncbi:MAG: STAS domain-containing protein [Deltaproteobacteria bacterium]|nr:STAS domain-containing protein [Deltaproteobacteria bacterium]
MANAPTAPSGSDLSGRLEPKLVTVLREGLTARDVARDATAGVIVGIVALPLAIAFAIASGVSTAQGLATAIVAGFLISALGGSRVQIGGPTGAFVVIVYGVVQRHGVDGLTLATLLAGAMLLLMGFARLGTVIQFVPFPVTVGFTAGIALIIATSQLRDVLGLEIATLPAGFLDQIAAYWQHAGEVSLWALAIGGGTTLLVALWPRILPRVPGSLVAIVLGTAAVQLLGLPVETIADRFGAVPSSLPTPHIPSFTLEQVRAVFPDAVSIALLGAIESLLSAVVADGMAGTRHRSNMELVAQGVANLASPLFGGIPATGAIARTATNVKNGGRTPIAGIVHSLTLLAILYLAGNWAGLIPLATLGGILLVVAWNMSELHVVRSLLKAPRSDVLVMASTFVLTIAIDLTVAIQVGMVLAAFLFMRRMAEISEAGYVRRMASEEPRSDDPEASAQLDVPDGVEMFELYGTLFFGAVAKFKDAVRQMERRPRVMILRIRDVVVIDASVIRALEDLLAQTRRDGTTLLLSGVHAQPLVAIERSGFLDRLGEHNALPDIRSALARAREI